MTRFSPEIGCWGNLDDIKDNGSDHHTSRNNSNSITAGYDRLAIQIAGREKAMSRFVILGGLSTVSEQNIAMFSGAG